MTNESSKLSDSVLAFSRMCPTSNKALCATKILPSQNFKKLGKTSSICGASLTISSVIEVNLVVNSDKDSLGLTKV